MTSLPKQPQKVQFRLVKRPVEAASSPSIKKARFKNGGDNFVLRRLSPSKDKIQTNDEIHQSIELCPVMRALVDTEAFQRLRNIKQLGTSEFLYVCANGNRFSHSLGVAHLAERMCKSIKEEQPNLGATDKDVLCVKLAGLLHDIGHGPYSHLYETFRHEALPNYLKANPDLEACYSDCEHLKVPINWSHEHSSLQMIDATLAELGLEIDLHNLDRPLRQIGDGVDANTMRVFKPHCVEDAVLTSRDFVFIKECILGKPLPEIESKSFIGRTEPRLEWVSLIQ
jgi:deoxynucleoside triphosphate triphosphohydrolase SAMHD1